MCYDRNTYRVELIYLYNTYQHLLCARHWRQISEKGRHGFMVLTVGEIVVSKYTVVNCVKYMKKEIDT